MGISGKWRITEMEAWDREAIDLIGPALIFEGAPAQMRRPPRRASCHLPSSGLGKALQPTEDASGSSPDIGRCGERRPARGTRPEP